MCQMYAARFCRLADQATKADRRSRSVVRLIAAPEHSGRTRAAKLPTPQDAAGSGPLLFNQDRLLCRNTGRIMRRRDFIAAIGGACVFRAAYAREMD
jgi:hypothetical protein